MRQIELPFEGPFSASDSPSLWTPREIWVRLTPQMMPYFAEGRRIDYKGGSRIDFADMAKYLSAFSNTPEGGVLVFGANSHGHPTGCNLLSVDVQNRIESCHTQLCPEARPEFRRIEVSVEGKPDFCIAVYVPCIGRLVETNKQESYIRYGDTIHKMSDEERQDFRSTRHELSFEFLHAPYEFPSEFDSEIVKDFCDGFRTRERRDNWSDQEILRDRFLLAEHGGKLKPTNAFVLLAALNPRKSIPGCRVRIQRFGAEQEGSGDTYAPLRDRFFEGNVVSIIRSASQELDELVYDVTWLNSDGKFETTPEYPKWAWFEALVNACVHRSYSFAGTDVTVKLFPNRMEIESPGGFVPPVNEMNLYHTRASRNPHLMDAMRYLGYVQMAREGTRRIRESMAKYRLPEPVFKQEALHGVVVKVTLFNDYLTRKRASDRDVAVYFGVEVWKLLQDYEITIAAHAYRNKVIHVSDASRLTGRTWATSKKDLDRLVRKGVLEFVSGTYTRDSKAHYRLVERTASASHSGAPK
ncbi:ATP-binding protein [Aestuariivirga sp.]|uniref:ATP-binding protein n=1 Tax=Aestuariivirga sp. TaxID=2650926 RepID=UPI0025C30AE9|nr:ATP-binding protein [Aestuariivirga sp.]MCA3555947.1 putative DNA binding domain-containing protein [Aestuariivirga sp.]